MFLILISGILFAQDFVKTGSYNLEVKNNDLKISLFKELGSKNLSYFDPDYIFQKTNEFSGAYDKAFGISSSACSSDAVNIYIVKHSTLNSKSMLDNWFYEDSPNRPQPGEYLLGLYNYEDGVNKIFISDSRYDLRGFDLRMAHEISHLWYKKSCKKYSSTMSDENMAVLFEKYIKIGVYK